MVVTCYKDLIVWQKSMQLSLQVYRITKQFPREEVYGLTSQVRRAAVSIPSNIAEGQARKSTREFRQFLSIARGSLAEVETQLLIGMHLGYVGEDELQPILGLQEEINRMLNSLVSKLPE
ncbi:four helix bundle protein [bacterium]|nr:four helix bundle protein [bacterium]